MAAKSAEKQNSDDFEGVLISLSVNLRYPIYTALEKYVLEEDKKRNDFLQKVQAGQQGSTPARVITRGRKVTKRNIIEEALTEFFKKKKFSV